MISVIEKSGEIDGVMALVQWVKVGVLEFIDGFLGEFSAVSLQFLSKLLR